MLKITKKFITPPITKEDWRKYHKISKEQIFVNIPNTIYNSSHESFFSAKNFHYIIKIQKQVCGILKFETLDNNEIALRLLAIDDEYKNNGLGKELVSFVISKSREMQITKIRTHASNKSLGFYKNLGFIEEVWNGRTSNPGTTDMCFYI